MKIEPIGWESDLGFRIAARYGLDFFIINEFSLIETGEFCDHGREPTHHELTMWYKIVPQNLCDIISNLYKFTERPDVEATVAELFCALIRKKLVYLNAKDFAIARNLRDFKPELDTKPLIEGKLGTFRNTDIMISRDIPHGYCYPTSQRVPELNWKSSNREIQPGLDLKIENEIVLGLKVLKQEEYKLNGEVY